MKPETPVTIKLSYQHWKTIGAALDEIPHKFARPILNSINEQLMKTERETQMPDSEARSE